MIRITECPRDAMQGIKQQIPTDLKVEYLNQLMKVGFEAIDCGSFVSSKAIPQMKDTAEVLSRLNYSHEHTPLLAIIANERGATDACAVDELSFLGFPFSISETFQQKNTNSSIAESVKRVEAIQTIAQKNNKHLLVYISMAFGNPYGDPWHPDIAIDWCRKLKEMGVRHFALADTTGSSDENSITQLFSSLLPEMNGLRLAAHLHSTREKAATKIKAAYDSGCRHFDVAIHGFGGCPMAKEELTGNIATEDLESFSRERNLDHGLNPAELQKSYEMAWNIFNVYH